MNRFHVLCDHPTGHDLERVVEPLASYICAAERPNAALRFALALLFREVEATNRAAKMHSQNVLRN